MNQLVAASEADPDLGFMARLMALCSLPRTNPGNRQRYVRRNGPYTLGMTAGINTKLPYGNLPRLLLAWICTEAVRTQKRELVLGKSLAEFMRTLGIYHNSGGRGGVHTRLRNQMDRLFHASVQLIYEDKGSKAAISSFVADRTEFWWNERKPNKRVLWESKIELGEKFFEEIISHPIPLDMNTLKALKRLRPGPRSLPVAGLPDLHTEVPAPPHLAPVVPPVRPRSGQGQRCKHRSNVPPQRAPGVEKDQAGLAGAELRNGQWRANPLSLEALHCSGRTAFARKLALNFRFPAQRSPLLAPPRPSASEGCLGRYKLHPVASHKARRRGIYPQTTVIQGSYPRLKRTYKIPTFAPKAHIFNPAFAPKAHIHTSSKTSS